MRNNLRVTAVFAVMAAAVPVLAAYSGGYLAPQSFSVAEAPAETAAETSPEPVYHISGNDDFPVYITSENRTVPMSVRDYVIGAVFAEMPADYPDEALKAQAAAAQNYALRKILGGAQFPDGAFISDDRTKFQPFLTPSEAEALYGDKYDDYSEKIGAAADCVSGYVLLYNGEPIVAAFHPLSAGMTESSEIVWGEPTDYLVPADSPFDLESPDHSRELRFSREELYARFSQGCPQLDTDIGDIIPRVDSVSPSGTVLNASVSGNVLSGRRIAELLSLPSAVFSVRESDGFAVFTVNGIGHGVGMSQYGAKRMAEEGCTWEEILRHYYNGIEIVSTETQVPQ